MTATECLTGYCPTIEGVVAIDYINSMSVLEDKTLIVMGSAPGHIRELRRVLRIYPDADIMTVNRAGRGIKYTVKHVATMHSVECARGRDDDVVRLGDIPPGAVVHGLNCNGVESPRVDRKWKIEPCCGGSGLFACVVGLALGYQRIMTVGIHLRVPPYNDDTLINCWAYVWYPVFKPYVRGWSGIPREIYGRVW